MRHTEEKRSAAATPKSTKSSGAMPPPRPWIGFAVAVVAILLIVGAACVRKVFHPVEVPSEGTAFSPLDPPEGKNQGQAPAALSSSAPEKKPAAAPAPAPAPAAAAAPAAGAGAAAGAAPARAETAPPSTAPASCDRDLDELRKLFRTIPETFAGLGSAEIQKIRDAAVVCRQRGEAFLHDCQGAAGYHEAQYMMAKTLLWLNRVAWNEFVAEQTKAEVPSEQIVKMRERWAAEYYGRIIQLGEAAISKLETGNEMRAFCLDLLGDALVQNSQPGKALERYRQLVAEYPAYKSLPTVYLSMANAHQDQRTYREGIALLRQGMAKFPDDPQMPNYHEWLWKLHSGAGDLMNLPKLVEEMRSFFPQRAKREGIGKAEKESCERYFVYSGFQLGYARFALGDFAGAIKAFQESIDFTDAREKELVGQGSSLPPDWAVYRTRCHDNLKVLKEKIGRRVNADLQNVIWAGDRKLALDGRPLVLVFRNYGEDRSAEFLAALDRHARKRTGAFELATISFLKGTSDPQGQAMDAFQEGQSLNLECAVGLDPDASKKSLFDTFDATVGSATFVVIDRAGNYAWFQQDPRKIDGDFSIAILERIIASSP